MALQSKGSGLLKFCRDFLAVLAHLVAIDFRSSWKSALVENFHLSDWA
jgi:hypothetical protein